MSIATLMVGGANENPAFAFEHASSHREIWEGITQQPDFVPTEIPLEPFWLDPRSSIAGLPASYWQIKHQNLHDVTVTFLNPRFVPTLGVNSDQSMVETDLNEPSGTQRWNLFVNLHLHLAAMAALARGS